MKFFRVYCKCEYSQFGDAERLENIDREIGDIIENVYATPHAQCAANMVAWNNDSAWEIYGFHMSESIIIVIESDDYYRPKPNDDFRASTDVDEVIIRSGKVINKYKATFDGHQKFADDYNVPIMGMYDFIGCMPNKKEVVK